MLQLLKTVAIVLRVVVAIAGKPTPTIRRKGRAARHQARKSRSETCSSRKGPALLRKNFAIANHSCKSLSSPPSRAGLPVAAPWNSLTRLIQTNLISWLLQRMSKSRLPSSCSSALRRLGMVRLLVKQMANQSLPPKSQLGHLALLQSQASVPSHRSEMESLNRPRRTPMPSLRWKAVTIAGLAVVAPSPRRAGRRAAMTASELSLLCMTLYEIIWVERKEIER